MGDRGMSTLITSNLKHPSSSSNNLVLNSDGSVTGAGLFSSYAKIVDQKSANTNGGSFSNGDWRTRDLNTELWDADGIVSISSNQFTLQAGTYYVSWICPAYFVDRHQSRLYNVTDSSTVQASGASYASSSGDSSESNSLGSARLTISGAKAFEIQHRSQSSNTSNGFGNGNQDWGESSIFTQVEIWKEN